MTENQTFCREVAASLLFPREGWVSSDKINFFPNGDRRRSNFAKFISDALQSREKIRKKERIEKNRMQEENMKLERNKVRIKK